MKKLKNIILEKLQIKNNSKAKTNNSATTTKKIISWLDLSKDYLDENGEYFKNIENWVINNHVEIKDLLPCANKETLNDSGIDYDLLKEFNDDYTLNEYCNEEIDHTHILDDNKKLGYEVRYSNKMICCICSIGTYYVIIKNKFNY